VIQGFSAHAHRTGGLTRVGESVGEMFRGTPPHSRMSERSSCEVSLNRPPRAPRRRVRSHELLRVGPPPERVAPPLRTPGQKVLRPTATKATDAGVTSGDASVAAPKSTPSSIPPALLKSIPPMHLRPVSTRPAITSRGATPPATAAHSGSIAAPNPGARVDASADTTGTDSALIGWPHPILPRLHGFLLPDRCGEPPGTLPRVPLRASQLPFGRWERERSAPRRSRPRSTRGLARTFPAAAPPLSGGPTRTRPGKQRTTTARLRRSYPQT
jgi:hypothetical protein